MNFLANPIFIELKNEWTNKFQASLSTTPGHPVPV